ncbi:hypothetical protein J2X65_003446 [Ancylobacter sp. 3268]|uniref:Hint domain-containing protein n=1 Tax=Ancylobacter sp. 3268 TaxID=2817752 RepID=UPI002854B9F1|nr:Hint domain-containing protein [Ancylobacter sp. 3268]MDR6954078.1 hypothetical protein [Ancylobacter sp. 3268]
MVAVFADPMKAYPIRIAADALGESLPARPLPLARPRLILDDPLVQAGALVNGTTITRRAPQSERFTWLHIELEDHALILVGGCRRKPSSTTSPAAASTIMPSSRRCTAPSLRRSPSPTCRG